MFSLFSRYKLTSETDFVGINFVDSSKLNISLEQTSPKLKQKLILKL